MVAYGPKEPYGENLANTEHFETMYLPMHQGENRYSIILTDLAGDGVCCKFGSGGPVELHEGPHDDGELLFTTPFAGTGREVHSFVIVKNSASFQGGLMPPSLTLIITLVSLFRGI